MCIRLCEDGERNQTGEENMAENSKIGWCHHTQNFWWGCNKVTRECKHCYIDGIMRGCGESLYRLEHLRQVPAAIKFVSAEPLLERMDFRPHLGWIDWIITGCERAAKGARQVMELDWVRDVDAQCKAAGKPHFFKQA